MTNENLLPQVPIDIARRTLAQRAPLASKASLAESMKGLSDDVQQLSVGFRMTPSVVSDILVAHQIIASNDLLGISLEAPSVDRDAFLFAAQQTLAKVVPVAAELPFADASRAAFDGLPDVLRDVIPAGRESAPVPRAV